MKRKKFWAPLILNTGGAIYFTTRLITTPFNKTAIIRIVLLTLNLIAVAYIALILYLLRGT